MLIMSLLKTHFYLLTHNFVFLSVIVQIIKPLTVVKCKKQCHDYIKAHYIIGVIINHFNAKVFKHSGSICYYLNEGVLWFYNEIITFSRTVIVLLLK